mmetsp:Transcript_80221/g.223411  ORF Transcript_80221/g.223411 Transcript_80221/m.223411 type:complete len:173 (-) Transcript_80221:165-683(-)
MGMGMGMGMGMLWPGAPQHQQAKGLPWSAPQQPVWVPTWPKAEAKGVAMGVKGIPGKVIVPTGAQWEAPQAGEGEDVQAKGVQWYGAQEQQPVWVPTWPKGGPKGVAKGVKGIPGKVIVPASVQWEAPQEGNGKEPSAKRPKLDEEMAPADEGPTETAADGSVDEPPEAPAE